MRPEPSSTHSVRSFLSNWQTIVAGSLALGLFLSIAGFALKADVVRGLPAADEVAGPPLGFVNYLDGAINSWKPMNLALSIFHSPHRDELFETLKDFQVGGRNPGTSTCPNSVTQKNSSIHSRACFL